MLTLIATTDKAEGAINIPVLDVMTNEQTARAILNAFTSRFYPDVVKCTKDVKEYVKSLNNYPEEVFCDPCYDIEGMEDNFILSFDFV